MPIDIGLINPNNVQKEGGAVAHQPCNALGTINSVHYGAPFDYTSFGLVVGKHWKYKGYYFTNDPYTPETPTDTVTSTPGAAASILYAADPYGSHAIDGVSWSYMNGNPGSGFIAVQVPSGTNVFQQDITGSGNGYITFPDPIRGSGNNSMFVTIGSGGGSVTARLNVFGHRVE